MFNRTIFAILAMVMISSVSYAWSPEDFLIDDMDGYMGAGAAVPTYRSESIYNAGTDGPRVAYSTDYAAVKQQIQTPGQAEQYLKQIPRAYHAGTAPYAPATFNSLKGGDCKDFASFFTDVLTDDGWQGTVIGMEWANQPKNGHTIGLVNKPGVAAYYISDYYVTQISSLDEIWPIEETRSGKPIGEKKFLPAGTTEPTGPWKVN